jgi:peptidoglycan hydrolase-like protein with peptidoglycan-binding domain
LKRVLLFFLVFVCCSTNENQEVSLITVDLNDESSTTTIDDTSTTTSTSITTTTTLPVTTTTSSTTTTSLPTTVTSIEEAQILLKNLGIYTGEIDGINGSLTKKAIREFQKLAGLVVDGVLGPNTINALINGENSYNDIGGADVEVSKTAYSEEIENAQIKLKELNLYTGDIDGINGIGTKNAIREFQKLAGLVVDGVLGPITSSALEKGKDSYVKTTIDKTSTTQKEPVTPVESTNENFTVDLRNYNPNADCINGYVNDSQVWVPDPCFYPVFVYRYGQIAQVNSQAELDAYLNQNWSLTKEKTYSSLGEVPTQNYVTGVNSPVNGLPMATNANNSIVIGIKNDNNVNARPQSGPESADAVFEVLVEGGMTRFINIFYQSDTNYHGPIRSARPTDPTVLRPLGGVLVASGATGGLIPEIQDMGVPVITDRRPDYFRISSRKAPHNLYADTSLLKSTAISRGFKKVDIPQPLFPWGDPSFQNWSNNSYLTLTFSNYTKTTWTWNGNSYDRTFYDAYKNQRNDNPHYWIDVNGNSSQISFKTVIALFCEPYIHPLQLPSVKTVGEGRAIILHGGKMIDAKWKRGSNLDPFHIVDSNNNILYVPKGKVWISLVPNTKNPSFG